jgi:hypothetical protein
MWRISASAPTAIALLCFTFAAPARDAAAQQQQRVSFKASSKDTHFTQQQNIEVGDVPRHIVRVFEVHRTYPDDPPIIDGQKLVEEWDRGVGNLIGGNGSSKIYSVYVMDNGEKFFARSAVIVQSGSGKLTSVSVGTITGGTGRFGGMRGFVRASSDNDLRSGLSSNQTDIEYSIGQ